MAVLELVTLDSQLISYQTPSFLAEDQTTLLLGLMSLLDVVGIVNHDVWDHNKPSIQHPYECR